MVCPKCGTQIDLEDGWERCFECKTPLPGTEGSTELSKDSLNELLMFLIPLVTIGITVISPYWVVGIFVLFVTGLISQVSRHLPNTAKELKRAFYPAVLVGLAFGLLNFIL